MKIYIKKLKKFEWYIIAFLFLAVNTVSFFTQQRISHNLGRGWDGWMYHKLAYQLVNDMPLNAMAPYHTRIGTPFIASLFPMSDLVDSFLLVNIFANFLSIILLNIFLKVYLKCFSTRALLLMIFMLAWQSPTRHIYYYPALTESYYFIFSILSLIILDKIREKYSLMKILVYSIVIFFGTAFREAILLYALVIPFTTNPLSSKTITIDGFMKFLSKLRLPDFSPIIFGIFSLLIINSISEPSNEDEFSFIRRSVYYFWKQKPAAYFVACFSALGPILIILLYNIKSVIQFLMRHQHIFVLLIGHLFLGWVGGTDTERVIFTVMPIFLILIGNSINKLKDLLNHKPLIITLIFSQAISHRYFFTLPDYPNSYESILPFFTPIGNKFPYLDLFAQHGDRFLITIIFVQYLVFSIFMLIWLYNRSVSKGNTLSS